MRVVFSAFAVLLTSGLAADADAPRALPIPRTAPVSVQGYGKQNPACARWTDGCVICTADMGEHASCSTPGIACEPRGVTCRSVRPAPAPP